MPSPMTTKMPVPMTAPTPSAVRWQRADCPLERALLALAWVSAMSRPVSLMANGPVDLRAGNGHPLHSPRDSIRRRPPARACRRETYRLVEIGETLGPPLQRRSQGTRLPGRHDQRVAIARIRVGPHLEPAVGLAGGVGHGLTVELDRSHARPARDRVARSGSPSPVRRSCRSSSYSSRRRGRRARRPSRRRAGCSSPRRAAAPRAPAGPPRGTRARGSAGRRAAGARRPTRSRSGPEGGMNTWCGTSASESSRRSARARTADA